MFRIIDDNPEPSKLRMHGLAPIAAAHWQASGRAVPASLEGERAAQVAAGMESERLIRTARAATEGPCMLIKGLEVATRYPDRNLRTVGDVDLLFRDAPGAQAAMLAAGFREESGPGIHLDPRSYDLLHNLCPLSYPGMSVPVEVHRFPHWPTWAAPPSFDELLDAARPASLGIDGVLAPCFEHHTLIVLAHSWARQPFERMSQLVDTAVLLEQCDGVELHRIARRWGLQRLLDTGVRTIDSLLLGRGADPVVVRLFASHLRGLTVPSDARQQYDRYAASVMVSSPIGAIGAAAGGLARRLRIVTREAYAEIARHLPRG